MKTSFRVVSILFVFVVIAMYSSVSCSQNAEGPATKFVRTESPAFTFSYPSQWTARPPRDPAEVLSVGPAGRSHISVTIVLPQPAPAPEDAAKGFKKELEKMAGIDLKILSQKPTQLKNGKPAYEALGEFMFTGEKRNVLILATAKDGATIRVHLIYKTDEGLDLKNILYSLEVEPDK